MIDTSDNMCTCTIIRCQILSYFSETMGDNIDFIMIEKDTFDTGISSKEYKTDD